MAKIGKIISPSGHTDSYLPTTHRIPTFLSKGVIAICLSSQVETCAKNNRTGEVQRCVYTKHITLRIMRLTRQFPFVQIFLVLLRTIYATHYLHYQPSMVFSSYTRAMELLR